jgi:glycosyltransferase involved in cell wall biosynthesis
MSLALLRNQPPAVREGTNIVIVTEIPSPYHIEYFDSISTRAKLRSVYLQTRHHTRHWRIVQPRHESMFVDKAGDAETRFFRWVDEADLVVFSHYRSPLVRAAMARREAAGRPWCYWGERLGFHGLGWLGTASRYVLMNNVHRSRAPIWAMGSWAIDSYRREFGPARRYVNVPYCSDLGRFRRAGETRARVGTFRFLYSGSLNHRKGVDLLARAFRKLATQLPRVSLVVLGHGPLRAKMEAMLAPVSERVTFAGAVDWDALPEYYAQADVLCAPSRYDGWGLIVPEGLASGLPVIATHRMGAAVDALLSGVNGWAIPAGDENALYQTMYGAATMEPGKWRDMSESAKTTAETFDLQAGTERFLNAVHDSLSAWANPALQGRS